MSAITSFDELTGVDHDLWRTHRELTRHIPRQFVGYRGCMGLGMKIEGIDSIEQIDDTHIFAKNGAVTWYTLLDLPYGKWLTAPNREVHLASVRRTGFKYGMPYIGQLVKQFDFRRCPYDAIVRGDVETPSDVECLKPSADEAAFRAFNALEWAMTSTAFFYRTSWSSRVKHYREALGLPKTTEKQLLFGQNIFDAAPASRHWMPRPYLAFPMKVAKDIYRVSTSTGLRDDRRSFPFAFKEAFMESFADRMPISAKIGGTLVEIVDKQMFGTLRNCKMLVIRDKHSKETARQPVLKSFVPKVPIGTTVAKGECLGWDGPEVPERFSSMSIFKRWFEYLPKVFGGQMHFESVCQLWFERQHVRLQPGYIHLPATIAAPAAMTLADDSALQWNIAPAMEYYNEPQDTFILPTIRQGIWNEHRLDLLPEVELDVRLSADHRFLDWPEDAVYDVRHARKVGKTERTFERRFEKQVPKSAPAVEPAAEVVEYEIVPRHKTPAVEPVVQPAVHLVDKKKFRNEAKAHKGQSKKWKPKSLIGEPSVPVIRDEEIDNLSRAMGVPLTDRNKPESQAKAAALEFEHDPNALKYRRPYLPKSWDNTIDPTSPGDAEIRELVAKQTDQLAHLES